ncbi:MAG: DNA polymerase III subunit delta' [Myxococcales bacterium]|nr:DNA polymerase III subunit delta' [Myxococcales bacterium]
MMILGEVRGQSRVVELLQRALQGERVAQSYLFAGPEGSGKYATALALAKAINCLSAPGKGCPECSSCNKIDEGIHPDVRTLEPEGAKGNIPIATIRKQVIPAMAMAPHEARARFFLVREASSMLGPAANALLKTLEEPPPRTHFILCSRAPSQLLPTIRSRCQRVSFQPLSPALRAQMQGDEEHAEKIHELSEKITDVIEERGLDGILSVAKVAGDRNTLIAALAQCVQTCHLAARSAATSADLPRAQLHARRAAEILNSLVAIREHNAHGQLALEHLLVALRGHPLPSAGAAG